MRCYQIPTVYNTEYLIHWMGGKLAKRAI